MPKINFVFERNVIEFFLIFAFFSLICGSVFYSNVRFRLTSTRLMAEVTKIEVYTEKSKLNNTRKTKTTITHPITFQFELNGKTWTQTRAVSEATLTALDRPQVGGMIEIAVDPKDPGTHCEIYQSTSNFGFINVVLGILCVVLLFVGLCPMLGIFKL